MEETENRDTNILQLPCEIQIEDDIKLELLSEKHVKSLYDTVERNKDFLMDSCPWVGEFDSIEGSEMFVQYFDDRKSLGECFCYGIIFKDTFVGCISISEVAHKKGEIGYWLDKEMNGRGIITKCARKLILLIFEHLKLEKIKLECQPENEKSLNIAKRLGFQFKKTLKNTMNINNKDWQIDQYELRRIDIQKYVVDQSKQPAEGS